VTTETTTEMVKEFRRVALAENGGIEAGLNAVLPIAEEVLRAEIAYRIRAEFVCCDIYQQTHKLPMGPRVGEGSHAICYWGEAAARIAEVGEPS
jgi:hypothetical protein